MAKTPSKPQLIKRANLYSWAAVGCASSPLVLFPAEFALDALIPFEQALIFIPLTAYLTFSLGSFVFGALALNLVGKVAPSPGWIRLRAAIGMWIGLFGLVGPCGLAILGGILR